MVTMVHLVGLVRGLVPVAGPRFGLRSRVHVEPSIQPST